MQHNPRLQIHADFLRALGARNIVRNFNIPKYVHIYDELKQWQHTKQFLYFQLDFETFSSPLLLFALQKIMRHAVHACYMLGQKIAIAL